MLLSDRFLNLKEALKAKGIGPKGNRPLDENILRKAISEMADSECPLALSAAFITAWKILPQTVEDQKVFEEELSRIEPLLPESLKVLLGSSLKSEEEPFVEVFFKCISRQDLNLEECRFGVDQLLNEQVSPAYKASFLQGLRVKRETDEENAALYRALSDCAPQVQTELECIIDLAEPFDGYKRNRCLSIEFACLLACFGYKVVLQSVDGLGPKYGENPISILQSLGATSFPDLNHAEAILNRNGVVVLRQEEAFSQLAQLKPLRNEMIKRPFLATFEKCLCPLKATKRQVLITGWVHAAYKTSIPKAIKSVAVCDEWILAKGIEGGFILDGSKKGTLDYGLVEGEEDCELSYLPAEENFTSLELLRINGEGCTNEEKRNLIKTVFSYLQILNPEQEIGVDQIVEKIRSGEVNHRYRGLLDSYIPKG